MMLIIIMITIIIITIIIINIYIYIYPLYILHKYSNDIQIYSNGILDYLREGFPWPNIQNPIHLYRHVHKVSISRHQTASLISVCYKMPNIWTEPLYSSSWICSAKHRKTIFKPNRSSLCLSSATEL